MVLEDMCGASLSAGYVHVWCGVMLTEVPRLLTWIWYEK
jgi:hypothetical protein